MGQQPASADIGDHADAGFGHGDLRRRADDAVAGIAADPDAAAHDEALHQRDDGLGIFGNAGVHAIFVAKEHPANQMIARARGVIQRRNVAAGAKGALTLGVDDDQRHLGVVAPRRQRPIDGQRHVVVERVQRLRPGEGDAPGAAVLAGEDVGHRRPPCHQDAAGAQPRISLLPRASGCGRRAFVGAVAGPVQPCLRPRNRKGQGHRRPRPRIA